MHRITLALIMAIAASAALAQPKEALTVDLPGDVATMDPHLQWDTESYTVYRNIFDNLVTRDVAGKIVPQVATAWRYTDDTTIVFDLRTDIPFHDGSRLTPDDVVFSIRRIINPALQEPATLPVRPDHIGGHHRARPGHVAYQDSLPGAHGTTGKAFHRAESLCGESWRP